MMSKRAVTLAEILIAMTVAILVIIPTTSMFSTSSKMLEKASNLTFASGLARYIIQGLMSTRIKEIREIPDAGISCCDPSEDNIYFYHLFNLKNQVGDLPKGEIVNSPESLPKFFNRCAKYDYRYSMSCVPLKLSDDEYDVVFSVKVRIQWKEFGVHKSYDSHAYIVPR